ncbi:MAG: PP2C family protein-serine/threonine phosphatase [Acidobacteriota bacterium]|nr:PP2C family protein-serine/threonine phosphatase [Acidobacteriota bacterium]
MKDYTAGLRAQDVRRLFDQDAAEAYGVLVRDQDAEAEPADGFRRFWYRVRVVFLGFSYKLTPVRRLLFAAAIILLVIGLLDVDVRFAADDRRLSIDFSALFFLLSVGSLVFLLALELVDRIRVRDELQVARELQSDLLPRDVPEIEGYRMRHSYRTANEVGGDYYDFSLLEDGRLAVMVGDASGHGMAAGLLMAIANATLKLAVDLDPAPPSVLRMLNRTLCRTGDRRSFMSIFYGLLDPTSGALEFASAGHPFPLLRRLGGEVEELGEGGLALGFRDDLEFRAYSTTVECGDAMVLYSDGLPEGVDGSGDSFGYERLRDLVTAGGTAEAIHERILLAFDQYRGDEPLADDFSLVVVGRSTTVPPPPP